MNLHDTIRVDVFADPDLEQKIVNYAWENLNHMSLLIREVKYIII